MSKILQLQSVLKKIENLREEIVKLYNERCLNDPELVEKSQELDKWLNEYNKIIKNNKPSK